MVEKRAVKLHLILRISEALRMPLLQGIGVFGRADRQDIHVLSGAEQRCQIRNECIITKADVCRRVKF